MKTTYVFLWSYDNFQYEYEESDKEYDKDTIWCSDYSWSRRGNRIYLHRKDIL